MSLVKQIGIAILATISLALFYFGSYYASKQIFPDSTATGTTVTPTPTENPNIITIKQMKDNEPKSVKMTKDGEDIVVTFETLNKVGVTAYITPVKSEKINQVMKDYRNQVKVTGKWIVATPDDKTSNTHSVRIPKSYLAANEAPTYFFLLLSYKAFWLPYGGVMDYVNGPVEPYLIKVQ